MLAYLKVRCVWYNFNVSFRIITVPFRCINSRIESVSGEFTVISLPQSVSPLWHESITKTNLLIKFKVSGKIAVTFLAIRYRISHYYATIFRKVKPTTSKLVSHSRIQAVLNYSTTMYRQYLCCFAAWVHFLSQEDAFKNGIPRRPWKWKWNRLAFIPQTFRMGNK